LCTGNDSDHLCLDCGKRFKASSELPGVKCPKCESGAVTDTWLLEGKPCPYCRRGAFAADPDFLLIS
jgi:DNA-directed RNA polymerase subunit RPC12/RpoP